MPALRTGLWATGGLLAVAAIGGGVYGVLTAEPPEPPESPPRGLIATPFIWPGKTRPATVPAADSRLADGEPVIGVAAGGRSRAYRVRALAGSMNQLVNDVVGGVPVTVSRCDQTGYVRVFTGPGDAPLPVMIGGYADGLLLKVPDGYYHQRDGRPLGRAGEASFPYPALDFREVSWKEWRTSHPDTDVYVGDPPLKPPPGKAN